MKRMTILWGMAAVLLALFATACGRNKEVLFNGKNLDGWVYFLADPAPDAEPVTEPTFSVVDGKLHVSGKPNGYIRTEKVFGDCTLRLEWRWVDQRVDGGIYVFLQEGDRVWPTGVQLQIRESDFGFFFSRIAMEDVDGPTYRKAPLCEGDPERPDGQWNKVEIRCKDGQLTAKVNGVLVNEALTAVRGGYIGFQSEGGAIEFRNITVQY